MDEVVALSVRPIKTVRCKVVRSADPLAAAIAFARQPSQRWAGWPRRFHLLRWRR